VSEDIDAMPETRYITRPDKDFVFKVQTSPLRCEVIRNPEFAFKKTKTINVGTDLYSFAEDRIEVWHYSDMQKVSNNSTVLKTTLGRNSNSRHDFSVSCRNGREFYITGGWRTKRFLRSVKFCMTTLKFSLDTKSYTDMPRLNRPRKNNSSCILDNKLYVFFGFDIDGYPEQSVERLHVTA